MPSTSRMVTMLLLNANGWTRTDVLAALNDAQNLLVQEQTEQTVVSVNGEFPSIDTQAGVYEYEIPDVWRVSEILIRYPLVSEYHRYYAYAYYGPFGYNYRNDFQRNLEMRKYLGKKYVRVQQISTLDRSPGNNSGTAVNAKVKFNFDPGDTTDLFLRRSYSLPTQLTSENIPPSIKSEKAQLTALFPTAMEMIKGYQNGDWDEVFQKIETLYKPIVMAEENAGEQGVSNFIDRREI